MALKLNCPKCQHKNALVEPLPLPDDRFECTSCSFLMTITYPPEVLKRLKAKNKIFREAESDDTTSPIDKPQKTKPNPPSQPLAQTSVPEPEPPPKNSIPLPPEPDFGSIDEQETAAEPPPPQKKKPKKPQKPTVPACPGKARSPRGAASTSPS